MRKDLKSEVQRGETAFADVLFIVPSGVETMKVYDLLVKVPHIGTVKATKLLRGAEISPSRSIGCLSGRQRDVLLALMEGGGRT